MTTVGFVYQILLVTNSNYKQMLQVNISIR